MDGERKINIGEGAPLTATGAANIYLNATPTKTKKTTCTGTSIRVNTTEKPAADIGVHINTTLSIASSKKIRLLFMLNFLLSLVCVIISCTIAFYYWKEMGHMRRQLDTIKDQHPNTNVILEPSPLIVEKRPYVIARDARMDAGPITVSQNARRYYVEDLGQDVVLMDSSKKSLGTGNLPVNSLPIPQNEFQSAHFHGALSEVKGGPDNIVGPWMRDTTISSKDSESIVSLGPNDNHVIVNSDGLYLIYAQLMYITHAPSCFFILARAPGMKTRQLSACATGDDSSTRAIEKAQISCSTQTVARLQRGDAVNIAQRDNRTLWLRKGYSFMGFVKLSS